MARVVGDEPGDELLVLGVVGGDAGGEEVDPAAHAVGVAGEHEAEAGALLEHLGQLAVVFEVTRDLLRWMLVYGSA